MKSLSSVVIALVLVVIAPVSAMAWNQTMTCITSADVDPLAPTSTPFCSGNQIPQPFRWTNSTVYYLINRAGSPDDFPHADGMDPELHQALIEAYEVWNEPECSRFQFVGGELSDVDAFHPTDEVNIFVFQDEWPYGTGSIALTSVTVRPDGEIIDADMELNDESYTFTDTDEPGEIQIDVRNTVTHEAGHVLGLDHSPVAEATMQYSAGAGQTMKRDLHEDDIEGLCAIYPIDGTDPEPDVDDEGCCSQVDSRTATPWWPALLLAGAVWGVRRRSRGPNRERKSS